MSDADEALALFKQGLGSTDRMIALETAQRINIVARAMGTTTARTVLLPYMEELTTAQKHEDEVLCTFAEALDASFLGLVGGPSTVFTLVKILLPLSCVTETAVRSRAVESLASVIACVPGSASATGGACVTGFAASEEWAALKAFIVNLMGSDGAAGEEGDSGKKEDTWFPSKLSACQLYPAVYACLPKEGMGDDKNALLESFAGLSDDEMPMVRATAASALAGLSQHVSVGTFRQHLLPIFKLVSEDRSDVVRECGVKSLAAYLGTLPQVTVTAEELKELKELKETSGAGSAVAAVATSEGSAGGSEGGGTAVLGEVVGEVTGLFLKASNDSSWRVRLAATTTLHDALKPADAKTKGELLAAFADLLDDEEGEVKLAATKVTAGVFEACTSRDMFDALVLPTVMDGFQQMLESAKVAADQGGGPDVSKVELRQTQALVAMELAKFDAIPHPTLVNVVQHMFEDSSLCIKMLNKFELLAKLKESDPQALSSICMDSLSLGMHDDWRVRCAFTARLSFIFEQIISVESSAAAAQSTKDGSDSTGAASTPKKGSASGNAAPSTPLDKDAVERAWTAFKSVVDGALWDEVAEARVHFVECLPALVIWADKIGGDRYVKQLLGMLVEQYKCESGVPIPAHPDRKMSYLYKISVLAGLQAILSMSPAPQYFGTANHTSELVDLVLAACKDATPNVRLVAGKAVGAYAVACCGGFGASPGAVQTVEMSLVPTLQTMSADSDIDVKTIAQMSLTQVTEALNSAN